MEETKKYIVYMNKELWGLLDVAKHVSERAKLDTNKSRLFAIEKEFYRVWEEYGNDFPTALDKNIGLFGSNYYDAKKIYSQINEYSLQKIRAAIFAFKTWQGLMADILSITFDLHNMKIEETNSKFHSNFTIFTHNEGKFWVQEFQNIHRYGGYSKDGVLVLPKATTKLPVDYDNLSRRR